MVNYFSERSSYPNPVIRSQLPRQPISRPLTPRSSKHYVKYNELKSKMQDIFFRHKVMPLS
jgi:hypothetical protein